jgi:transketolase C-terminal domain/subunit
MSFDLSTTELAIVIAAGIAGAAYIAFILAPAIVAYGRVWEKIAAGFLRPVRLAQSTSEQVPAARIRL